jgi:hypothetical protein
MLWNSAALLPLCIVLAAAIIARPALNLWRERLRVYRVKLEAVAVLDTLQSNLIDNSDFLPEGSGSALELISTTLNGLRDS